MTDKEHAALRWLDEIADHGLCNDIQPARTLKAMLARPTAPDVNDHRAIDELKATLDCAGWDLSRMAVVAVMEALHERARLLREPPEAPMKEVEVERWFVASRDMGHLYGYVSEEGARDDVHAWDVAKPKDGPHFAIRLTGKAMVPVIELAPAADGCRGRTLAERRA